MAAVLAALLGVLAVAHVDDVDADGDVPEKPISLGEVEVGVGYTSPDQNHTAEGAQFSAKISEQAYVNEDSYQVVWTISYVADVSEKTWTFTYTKGEGPTLTATNPDGTAGTDIPKIAMERGDVGYYIITMSDFPKVENNDATYNFTITSQIYLTIYATGDLVLNTNTFSATVVTYNNCLATLSIDAFTAKANGSNKISISSDSGGKTISQDYYDDYTWYATDLPDGLTIKDGVISGMPVTADTDGTKVVLAVRGTDVDAGREYYGTLSVVVKKPVAVGYEISISCTNPGDTKKLVVKDDYYVAVNGTALTLSIDSANFDGQATVIDASSGLRTDIELQPVNNSKTGAIPSVGVGTYIVKVVWDGGSCDITLKVVAQTAGTSGAGFVVVGS